MNYSASEVFVYCTCITTMCLLIITVRKIDESSFKITPLPPSPHVMNDCSLNTSYCVKCYVGQMHQSWHICGRWHSVRMNKTWGRLQNLTPCSCLRYIITHIMYMYYVVQKIHCFSVSCTLHINCTFTC